MLCYLRTRNSWPTWRPRPGAPRRRTPEWQTAPFPVEFEGKGRMRSRSNLRSICCPNALWRENFQSLWLLNLSLTGGKKNNIEIWIFITFFNDTNLTFVIYISVHQRQRFLSGFWFGLETSIASFWFFIWHLKTFLENKKAH